MADVKRAVDIAGETLELTSLDGRAYWLARSPARVPAASPSAHLLPAYDEYFIGLRDRSAIARHLVAQDDALLARFAFVNGQIVGRWGRSVEKETVVITLEPLMRITAADERRLAADASRFGEFLGLPVEYRA